MCLPLALLLMACVCSYRKSLPARMDALCRSCPRHLHASSTALRHLAFFKDYTRYTTYIFTRLTRALCGIQRKMVQRDWSGKGVYSIAKMKECLCFVIKNLPSVSMLSCEDTTGSSRNVLPFSRICAAAHACAAGSTVKSTSHRTQNIQQKTHDSLANENHFCTKSPILVRTLK